MRGDPSTACSIWAVLGEPIGWILVGLGALFGVAMQVVFAMTFVFLLGAPVAVILLYLHGVRKGDFFCPNCEGTFKFAQVRYHTGKAKSAGGGNAI